MRVISIGSWLLAVGAGLTSAAAPAAAQLLGTPVVAAAPPVAAAPDSGLAPPAGARAGTLYRGVSGALRAVIVDGEAELSEGALRAAGVEDGSPVRWVPLHGTGAEPLLGTPLAAPGMRAPAAPGIWRLASDGAAWASEAGDAAGLAVVTRVPFTEKRSGRLNGYHIGAYPTEGAGRGDRYAPPVGFIEVTRENQDFHVSENFRLRQFLTKDQHDVWPKYLVLDLRLIDKLELVLQELNAMGVRADRMHVMSGFRTPQYNGPGTGGRAQLSRHTYGDAADVWVDSDGNGYMDDLNGDGVVDLRDAEVMLRAVERVERRHPELVGGAGLYVASPAHGPYIHIDVRGTPARW